MVQETPDPHQRAGEPVQEKQAQKHIDKEDDAEEDRNPDQQQIVNLIQNGRKSDLLGRF